MQCHSPRAQFHDVCDSVSSKRPTLENVTLQAKHAICVACNSSRWPIFRAGAQGRLASLLLSKTCFMISLPFLQTPQMLNRTTCLQCHSGSWHVLVLLGPHAISDIEPRKPFGGCINSGSGMSHRSRVRSRMQVGSD